MGIENAVSMIVTILLIVVVLILIVSNIQVVQQSRAYVVERLGAYSATWGVGLHLKIPFIERVVKKVSLKEQVADFDPQPVITKDNVTMQIDTVIYFQITDPKLYTYGVEHPMNAIENLTATTLRNIIGDMELDQSLTSRDIINAKMRSILDEATDPWGIKVNRVELKNILPPREIQNAMEKQMKAERERRESILQAEGQKQSQILVAEGEKQSAVLRAEAEREAAILRAEGEAEAIRKVQQALADSIKMLNEANPNDQVVKIKALEAYEKAADGQATKIIIPSEIQSLAGLAASFKGLLEEEKQYTTALGAEVEPMISVRCRSCGRQYDYSKDDCCPRCGAYNRPPRHERVDADGTVHHLTDAEYAARGRAVSGKVCFEEKSCYEDEARPKASRRKPAEKNRKAGLSAALTALLIAFVIPAVAVIVRDAVSESRNEEPTVWVEPPDDFGETVVTETDAPYHETPRFYTAEDGSVFSLLGWRRQGYAIAVELIADFADSNHEFYASLECVDGFGNLVTLSEFESESGETEVLYFLTEDETLTPQTFVLEEWDYETEEGLVSLWEANLQS